MGIFRSIIDLFRRLLGLSREPVLSLGSGTQTNAKPAVPSLDEDDDDVEDDDVAVDLSEPAHAPGPRAL